MSWVVERFLCLEYTLLKQGSGYKNGSLSLKSYQLRCWTFSPVFSIFRLWISLSLDWTISIQWKLPYKMPQQGMVYSLSLCYGTKCFSPTNSYAEILNTEVMVSGGRNFGRWLGHEGVTLMNGISALIQETSENSFAPSAMCGHSTKTAVYEPGSRPSSDIKTVGTWS